MSARFYHLAQHKQTYLNILYLLASFPLGLIYFVFLVTMIAVGLGTVVIWVGVPILLFAMAVWWYFAAFERILTISWLHVPIHPISLKNKIKKGLWTRVRAQLSNAMTWKTLAYLFLKFPLGILSFVLVLNISMLVLSLSIIAFVLGFFITPFFYLSILVMGAPPNFLKTTASRQILLLGLTGCGLPFAPLYLLNGLAWLWGQLAHTLLGMSDNAMRVAEAEAIAAQERSRAERADQSRRELIVNVSHELRTPVASIRGHIESLLMDCDAQEGANSPSPEALHKYLTIVHREAIRLGTLVEDLLSLARTEASELCLKVEAVPAGEVVEDVYQTLMPLARRERRITMIRDIVAGLPPVQADRQRLMQVLLNLVRNAITYTPDGGIVSIKLAPVDEKYLVLSVADTGIGISLEDQEYIFERFYRTDASRTRTSGGFGLGLAIVRDFVTAMGGSISVESRVGEGSCFHVCLHIV